MKRREMLKTATTVISGSLLAHNLPARNFSPLLPDRGVEPSTSIKRFGDGRDWFFQKRFGMFVHWGIYAIPAWHEQYAGRAMVTRAEYEKFAQQWNPKKFDPDKWLDLMQEAGMKYVTFTAKHHDGFCLWNTKMTPFNTMNTPYRKDILAMLSEACHRRGIPLCLYYSIADLNHPNYPNRETKWKVLGTDGVDRPDMEKYMEFLKGQVKELCTNYGKIHGFWWDGNITKHKDPSVNKMIRELQPGIIINNRGFSEGDFDTPERDYDKTSSEAAGFDRPTEACQAVGMRSWGYRKDEDYYCDRHLIRSIDRYLARDANYLLNVGPTAEGLIDDDSSTILRGIGKWYFPVKESFEGTEPFPDFTTEKGVLATRKENAIYVHLPDLIGDGQKLRPVDILPHKATLLNTGENVKCVVDLEPRDYLSGKKCLMLQKLPVNELCGTTLIVKLEFDDKSQFQAIPFND